MEKTGMDKKLRKEITERKAALKAIKSKHPQTCKSCNNPIVKGSPILNYRSQWLHADCARTQMRVDRAIEKDDAGFDRRAAREAYIARNKKRRTA